MYDASDIYDTIQEREAEWQALEAQATFAQQVADAANAEWDAAEAARAKQLFGRWEDGRFIITTEWNDAAWEVGPFVTQAEVITALREKEAAYFTWYEEKQRIAALRTIRITTTATMYRIRATGDVIERIIADFTAGVRIIDELVEAEWDINDWRTERLMLATAHIVAIRERL